MWRVVAIYAVILAAGALGLQWLEYRYLVQAHPIQTYVALVALAFLGLGVWAGTRLSARPSSTTATERNHRAVCTLGISERELEVLELLAAGRSNKEIAKRLNVSPNTVKTHVARLYEKLQAKRRTEAVLKARELGMIG